MRVGDLIRYTIPSSNKFYIGLVVADDIHSPWVRWVDDNQLEPLDNYDDNIVKECFEVISAGR